MPAAAVIPAPIAYIKVVAVKKLVVEVVGGWFRFGISGLGPTPNLGTCDKLTLYPGYCEEIRVFKAGVSMNRSAWNNKYGQRSDLGFLTRVRINRASWGH